MLCEKVNPLRRRTKEAGCVLSNCPSFHVCVSPRAPADRGGPRDTRLLLFLKSVKVPATGDVKLHAPRCSGLSGSGTGHRTPGQLIDGADIVIRVAVAHYAEAITRVEAIGRVVHRKAEATDVTEEYVDLEARLRNALAVRARLEALLARAEDVTAALEVEKELKRLGEEIEQLEAKLELIKNRAALSTISVRFERVARKDAGLLGATQLPFAWLRTLDPQRLLRTR